MEPEPIFVGQSRQLVVDGIVSCFESVNSGTGPLWVDIQAPSGWGKTRIAREFYKSIAATHQDNPPYWPPTIVESWESELDLQTRRKLVYPRVVHNPGSLPNYFWWGLTAGTRDPVASLALSADCAQFDAHVEFLDDAWRKRVSATTRHRSSIRGTLHGLSEPLIDEIAAEGVQALLGAAIPGIGLLGALTRRAVQHQREASDRARRINSADDLTNAGTDFAAQVYSVITRIAVRDLPIVVFVEDAHRMDGLLSRLLRDFINSDSAVLILTTSWNGYAESNSDYMAALGTRPDRTITILPDSIRLPAPFPAGANLQPLDASELKGIVEFHLSGIDQQSSDLLAARFQNPYTLELACNLPRLTNHKQGTAISLSEEDIQEIPMGIADLYRELWKELPLELRRTLSYSSFGVPAAVADANRGSLVWSESVVAESINGLHGFNYDGDLLGRYPQAKSWCRRTTTIQREFNEPEHLYIAHTEDAFLSSTDRTAVYRAIGATLESMIAGQTVVPSSEWTHIAELALALHARGLIGHDAAIAAQSMLLRARADSPTEIDDEVHKTQDLLINTPASTAAAAALNSMLDLLLKKSIWGPPRPTYSMTSPAPIVTFNSIVNHPYHGDERNFVHVKHSTRTSSGGWRDELAVKPGDEIWVRAFVSNNISPAIHETSMDTRVRMVAPASTGSKAFVYAEVSAENAQPKKVWSSARIFSDSLFRLVYVSGSGRWFNNTFTDGAKLSNDLIRRRGVLIGAHALDGRMDGKTHYDGTVTAKFAVLGELKPLASVECLIRETSNEPWRKTIELARPGIFEFLVQYKNIGNTVQHRVQIFVKLPEGVTILPRTTALKNSNNPTGSGLTLDADDELVRTGIRIGDYATGSNAFISFAAAFYPQSNASAAGTVRIYGHALYDGNVAQAFADIICR